MSGAPTIYLAVGLPPDVVVPIIQQGAEYYIGRALRSLGANGLEKIKIEIIDYGYGLDRQHEVEIRFRIPKTGFTADSIEQALYDNRGFLGHGIVIGTNEIHTREISGCRKYETVVE